MVWFKITTSLKQSPQLGSVYKKDHVLAENNNLQKTATLDCWPHTGPQPWWPKPSNMPDLFLKWTFWLFK